MTIFAAVSVALIGNELVVLPYISSRLKDLPYWKKYLMSLPVWIAIWFAWSLIEKGY